MSLNVTILEQDVFVNILDDTINVTLQSNNDDIDCLFRVTVNTTPTVLNFDFNGFQNVIFNSSAIIAQNKTWSLPSDSVVRKAVFRFNISGIFTQQMPNNVKMTRFDMAWDATLFQWTPVEPGLYEAEMTYDNTNWYIKITPF